MAKATSFDGDLGDQDRVRAKLADVEAKIEQRERVRDRIEDDLIGLERLREGLLVILGEKESESNQARSERLERERERSERFRAYFDTRTAATTIQAKVENLVSAMEHPVSAGELLQYLPAGTKREAVN